MGVYNMSGEVIGSIYGIDGNAVRHGYDVSGEEVFPTGIDYSDYTANKSFLTGVSGSQGFAYYDGYIFQMTSSNTVVVINASTGTTVSTFSISSDHGDSVSFSDEEYAESDVFPLLYVTADTNPAKVYVNRVTASSSELVKTLLFPLEKTGYYAAHAYDEANSVIYMLGYSQQNYLTDNDGANKTVVSKWDMTQLTLNQDGSYTPTFVSSYEIPFIYCMQGQQYHDGMIWVSSGYSSGSNIYVLNPDDGEILYTIDLQTTAEVEGLDFMSDTEMIVGFWSGSYWKYTFATN